MGLWLIQQSRKEWQRQGLDVSFDEMERAARGAEPFKCFIDPDDPVFVTPGNQVQRIKDYCQRTGQSVPETDGEIVRCIYESLAMKYKYTFDNLKECTGSDFKAIHMVGGGTQANLL